MADKNIPESIVRLLFDQLKESDSEAKESISALTVAITDLVKALGDNPTKTIELLETIIKNQETIDAKFKRLFWGTGIFLSAVGLVLGVLKTITWWMKTVGGGP